MYMDRYCDQCGARLPFTHIAPDILFLRQASIIRTRPLTRIREDMRRVILGLSLPPILVDEAGISPRDRFLVMLVALKNGD